MIAICIIVIWQDLGPICCNIGIGTTHRLLLIVSFLSVACDTDRPRRTCCSILNCRRRRIVSCTGVNLVVANHCFVRSSLDSWNWERAYGPKRCGDDIYKRLIEAARTAASENPSTKKITASGFASKTAPVTAVPCPSEGSSRM